jgi:hypothetical protein
MTYRVSVELPSGAKFQAEGEIAPVREDLDKFFDKLLNHRPRAQELAPQPEANTLLPAADNGAEPDVVASQAQPPTEALEQSILDRLFAKDKHGTVSLRALPHNGEGAEANAMLALIYGAQVISGEHQVSGSRLKKAAAQSGLHQVERVDRSLQSQIGQFVTTAGFKKGRRYGLTNPGIRRAQEVLKAILG